MPSIKLLRCLLFSAKVNKGICSCVSKLQNKETCMLLHKSRQCLKLKSCIGNCLTKILSSWRQGGLNKCERGAKFAKLINVDDTLLCFGTIHKRCRHFFWIFDTSLYIANVIYERPLLCFWSADSNIRCMVLKVFDRIESQLTVWNRKNCNHAKR